MTTFKVPNNIIYLDESNLKLEFSRGRTTNVC